MQGTQAEPIKGGKRVNLKIFAFKRAMPFERMIFVVFFLLQSNSGGHLGFVGFDF